MSLLLLYHSRLLHIRVILGMRVVVLLLDCDPEVLVVSFRNTVIWVQIVVLQSGEQFRGHLEGSAMVGRFDQEVEEVEVRHRQVVLPSHPIQNLQQLLESKVLFPVVLHP